MNAKDTEGVVGPASFHGVDCLQPGLAETKKHIFLYALEQNLELQEIFQRDSTVIDLCCGEKWRLSGFLQGLFHQNGIQAYTLVGVDVSAPTRESTDGDPNAKFIQEDVFEYSRKQPSDSVDLILLLSADELFEYKEQQTAFFTQANRIIKNGGYLWYYGVDEIVPSILASGFTESSVSGFFRKTEK